MCEHSNKTSKLMMKMILANIHLLLFVFWSLRTFCFFFSFKLETASSSRSRCILQYRTTIKSKQLKCGWSQRQAQAGHSHRQLNYWQLCTCAHLPLVIVRTMRLTRDLTHTEQEREQASERLLNLHWNSVLTLIRRWLEMHSIWLCAENRCMTWYY